MAVPVSYYIYGKKIRNIDVKGIFVSKFTVPTYVIIIKIKVLLTLAELSTLFRPFGFLVPKDFKIIWLLNILSLSVSDEDYSRNASYGLNVISTFLLKVYFCQSKER
jgi:hypothetical protein